MEKSWILIDWYRTWHINMVLVLRCFFIGNIIDEAAVLGVLLIVFKWIIYWLLEGSRVYSVQEETRKSTALYHNGLRRHSFDEMPDLWIVSTRNIYINRYANLLIKMNLGMLFLMVYRIFHMEKYNGFQNQRMHDL